MKGTAAQHSLPLKKILKYLLFLLLAGVLLYISFKEVHWGDFIDGLKGCNFWWIAVSMFVGFLGFVARALRWRLLLLPLNSKVTFKEAYDGVTVAYITNFAVPRAGEIARCGVVARSGKVTFEGALGTMVLERAFDMICLLLWIVVLLLFKWNEFGGFMSQELYLPLKERFDSNLIWFMAAIVVAGIALCAAAWIYRKRLLQVKLFAKIAEILKGLGAGLLAAFRMKHKWMFLLYTAFLWFTYWLTSYTTIQAFPSVGHLTGSDALFLMIVGGLGWVVPVQGGLGAYHFIVSLALAKVYGIVQTTGVIFATISHESQALVMIICGAVSLISLSLAKKSKKSV